MAVTNSSKASYGLAGESRASIAEIHGVVPDRLDVGPDIERDRKAYFWRHAGTRRIQRQLSDRDAHAVRAEIAKSKDAAAVGDDDDAGASGPVAKQIRNATRVLGGWTYSPRGRS